MLKQLSFLCFLFAAQLVFAQTICSRHAPVFGVPSGDYDVDGSATLVDSLGTLYLKFSSDFSTSPGPDLYVYLTETGEAPTAPGNDDYEIALLISNTGAQTYTLPSSISIDDYDYVTIHCKQYNHLWNSALFADETCYTFPTYSSQTVESCFNYTSPSGNQIWMNSGTYVDTLVGMNVNGGDSIVTVELTINDVNTDVEHTITTNLLRAEASNSTFQWIDCADQSILPGETNAEFNPAGNGSYAVIVTSASNCVDTSACFAIHSIGVNENQIESYDVYPNPSTGVLHIKTLDIDPVSIQIFNTIQQNIPVQIQQVNTHEVFVELPEQQGMYLLSFKNKQGHAQVVKVIKD